MSCVLNQHQQATASALLQAVRDAVQQFQFGEQSDDITLVMARYRAQAACHLSAIPSLPAGRPPRCVELTCRHLMFGLTFFVRLVDRTRSGMSPPAGDTGLRCLILG